MFKQLAQFGETSSSGGISSLGLNLKAFIFQLITFVLVLLILSKWVFPRLVATLEKRREVLEQSLVQAKETEETLRQAESKAGDTLQTARTQADAALADAQAKAKEIIAEGEKAGAAAAERIKAEAEAFLRQEAERLRQELKTELVDLVIQTTAKVIEQKLTLEEDRLLIQDAIKVLPK